MFYEDPIPGYSKYEVRVSTYYRTEDMKKFFVWGKTNQYAVDKTRDILQIFYPELDFNFEQFIPPCDEKVCEFDGISSIGRSTIQAYLYIVKEKEMDKTVVITQKEYDHLLEQRNELIHAQAMMTEGILVKLPWAIGTSILIIQLQRSGEYRLGVGEFSFSNMEDYKDGRIFTDVKKAGQALIDFNSRVKPLSYRSFLESEKKNV